MDAIDGYIVDTNSWVWKNRYLVRSYVKIQLKQIDTNEPDDGTL